MLDYMFDSGSPAPKSELYRFCRDECLDYTHTVAGIKGKRRKSGNALAFFHGIRSRRRRRAECAEQCCRYTLSVQTE